MFIFFLLALVIPFQITYADQLIEMPQDHHMILKHHSYEILGIGTACMDLLIPISEEFLNTVPGEKGGAEVIDIQGLQQIIKDSGQNPYLATGGSCANTIKGLANLKIPCALLSTIGSDKMGEHFTRYMQKLGVIPLFWQSHLPNTQVLCLITPDGQRTMRFYGGSNQDFTEHLLRPDYLKGAKIVHMEAYSIRNGNLLREALQLAKKMHAKVSMDLSSFEIVREYKDTLRELLSSYVDIVFANEDEVRELTGLPPYEGCVELQKMCPIAIVLMGKNGCLVGHRDEILASYAFPVKAIDTTGSGDLFASGFLYGYIKGYPLELCARFGNRLGGAITQVVGTELPEETWQAIRQEFTNAKILTN